MFANISERWILVLRWGLVLGWIVLIASLFYDPYTAQFTEETSSGPLRLNKAASLIGGDRFICPTKDAGGVINWHGLEEGTCDSRCPRVRDRCLVQEPYPIAARVFWTMALPLLPLLFMVFGHEFWRRICPLSALMQIPRKLARHRKVPYLNPKTGVIQWRISFISTESWLGRHPTVLPFLLLCLGVTIRLLFINSDRVSLAIFFLFVIAAAMMVGYFYGGKTWCHYICPISVVQKIYTEPRGLLESWPHINRSPVPQSMCRKTSSEGDVSNCVACISSCPDIDLERQYWAKINERGRSFVHYGYVGMILSFYGYYALYSGNWGYYFTGVWTHDESQLSTLLAPGFYWLPEGTWMVKAIAAPLTIALSVLLSCAVGYGLEWIAFYMMSRKKTFNNVAFKHHTYLLSAFVAFNCFYFFGGRPNIMLLPEALISLVDLGIVAVSVVWVARSWYRSPRQYKVESVGSRLRRQLTQSEIDLSKALDGRSVDMLSYEEVYALGNVLPSVDATARLKLYRDALAEALSSSDGAFSEFAAELREKLNISDSEHRQVMAELGIAMGTNIDEVLNAEELWRTMSYREALVEMVRDAAQSGVPLEEALASPKVQKEILMLQGTYRINDEQHQHAVYSLIGTEGAIFQSGKERVDRLVSLKKLSFFIDRAPGAASVAQLVVHELERSQLDLIKELLRVVIALDESPEVSALTMMAVERAPEQLRHLLDAQVEGDGHWTTWRALLGETVATTIEAQLATASPPDLQMETPEINDIFEHVELLSPMGLAALISWWIGYDKSTAMTLINQIETQGHGEHWLIKRACQEVRVTERAPDIIAWVAQLMLTEFYRDAEAVAVARLLWDCKPHVGDKGETIFRQGDLSDNVVCILNGELSVLLEKEGAEDLILAKVKTGETLGELGVINNEPRTATVRVASEQANLLFIDQQAFDEFLARESKSVLRLVSRRLTNTLRRQSAS